MFRISSVLGNERKKHHACILFHSHSAPDWPEMVDEGSWPMREDLARDVGGWKVHACVMHSNSKVDTRAMVDVMTDQDLRILAGGDQGQGAGDRRNI